MLVAEMDRDGEPPNRTKNRRTKTRNLIKLYVFSVFGEAKRLGHRQTTAQTTAKPRTRNHKKPYKTLSFSGFSAKAIPTQSRDRCVTEAITFD